MAKLRNLPDHHCRACRSAGAELWQMDGRTPEGAPNPTHFILCPACSDTEPTTCQWRVNPVTEAVTWEIMR